MFIDSNGRLFGKINIIDLMVIIFLLSLTPMGYYGWKIYNRPQPQPQPKTTLEISIKEYGELKSKIIELRSKIINIDNFLEEHKHARKYFK